MLGYVSECVLPGLGPGERAVVCSPGDGVGDPCGGRGRGVAFAGGPSAEFGGLDALP